MSKPKSDTAKRSTFAFAAIDPYLEQYAVKPTEKDLPGKDRVQWGTGDRYPDYINELYETVPTLQTVINGSVDFVAGDEVVLTVGDAVRSAVNHSGDTPRDTVREAALDTFKLGGFALQVIRNYAGDVADVYPIPMDYLRSNKDNTVFYYCEDWVKKGRTDAVVYPRFRRFTPEEWAQLTPDERDRHASSIYYYKTVRRGTYPRPPFTAATKDAEIERNVTDFHFNSLENGFNTSMIINFNNGVPEDEMKREIEADVNEKFSGHQNGMRVMLSWNPNKDSATTFEVPKVEDFGERYKALSTHSRQQLFASFRAVPALFGIMTESTGFNEQEFEQAFRLYNRTAIRPVQRAICDAFDAIYGEVGVLTIKPFTLDGVDQTVD
jgi:hypothetical protein